MCLFFATLLRTRRKVLPGADDEVVWWGMAEAAPGKRNPIGCVVCLLFVFLVGFGLRPYVWPPPWVERRSQRQTVGERIQSVGGWAALQRDCEALVQQNRNALFTWNRRLDNSNALPTTLRILSPERIHIEHYATNLLRDSALTVVKIKVFGQHSTGGHSTPYFGLEIISGKQPESYWPEQSLGGVSGNRQKSYRKVTESIYEIY